MNIDVAPSDNVLIEREGDLVRVYFDFKREKVYGMDGKEVETPIQHSCQNVDVRGNHSYGAFVGAIVNDKYSADDVQALQFNYELAKDEDSLISDEKREEYLAEYKAFQDWRAHAKEVAAKVIEKL